MRLVGMLIALFGVLALIYYLSGDILGLKSGSGGKDATLAPAAAAGKVIDKMNLNMETTKQRIEQLDK